MKKIIVTLSPVERQYLTSVTKKGTHNVRVITRARILLLSDQGEEDPEIAHLTGVSEWTVRQVRKRYHDRATVHEAIHDAPRPGQPGKMTPEAEAFIVATACTEPPHGHDHWFLEDLREAVNETYDLALRSPTAIRAVLIRNELKPWREKNVVHSQADGAVQRAAGRYPDAIHRTAPGRSRSPLL